MPAPMSSLMLASAPTGEESWASFLASFRRTAAEQFDMLPVLAFVLLVVVMIVLNWKVAKRLARRAPTRRAVPREDDHEDRRDEGHSRAA